MKHLLVTGLMFSTVALFLVLKVTGYLRLEEMNPISLFGLKLVLFVSSAGFYAVSATKFIYMLIDYQPNPINIAIYISGFIAALYAAWITTRYLTKD